MKQVEPALLGALEGLKLANRELPWAGEDPERWRWVAVGLVTALKCALIAALSGYETASPGDTADLKDATRVAPLALLLRRARSERYLVAPERLQATAAEVEACLRLAAYRNQVVHGVAAERPDRIGGDCRRALGLVRHLLVAAPAFDPARHAVTAALISDEISRLQRQLGPVG